MYVDQDEGDLSRAGWILLYLVSNIEVLRYSRFVEWLKDKVHNLVRVPHGSSHDIGAHH